MTPWSSSIDIIDKYFAEPTTQAIIQETEQIRQTAYNAKQEFYKKYRRIVLITYIVIAFFAYIWLIIFDNDLHPTIIFLSIAPWPLFRLTGQNKQKSIIKSKLVTTKLFDNFIKYIFPGAIFHETDILYHGDPLDSKLFIRTEEEQWFFASSVSVDKDIRNSINIPLLQNEKNEITVQLEWVEVRIDKTTWSGKSKKTETDMGMLYKIIFKNPRRIIKQSVKVIQNSNSRFKEKDNLISLENQEFEKHFDVYSKDPIEARMILTPNVMDKLAEISRITQGNYSFHFMDNIFYIKNELYNNDANKKNINNITDLIEVAKGTGSIINVDRDSSIEKNKDTYRDFYNEMISIKEMSNAMNIDYFNKLS